MTVHIDDRAGSRELIKHPPLDEVGELCRLDSADCLIVGNGPDGKVTVGVEVKSIEDLLSSMSTGRLQGTQLPAMQEAYDEQWILYYGDFRPNPANGELQVMGRQRIGKRWVQVYKNYRIGNRAVPYGYLKSFTIELATMGIRIERVADIREAALWVGCLYRWWSKPWSKHKGMRKFDNSRNRQLLPGISNELKQRAMIAAQLPGLGFERAVAAAHYFTSPEAMMVAPASEWEKVPGVGKVIARAVREAIRG